MILEGACPPAPAGCCRACGSPVVEFDREAAAPRCSGCGAQRADFEAAAAGRPAPAHTSTGLAAIVDRQGRPLPGLGVIHITKPSRTWLVRPDPVLGLDTRA